MGRPEIPEEVLMLYRSLPRQRAERLQDAVRELAARPYRRATITMAGELHRVPGIEHG